MENTEMFAEKMKVCEMCCSWLRSKLDRCPNIQKCKKSYEQSGGNSEDVVIKGSCCIMIEAEDEEQAKEFCLCDACPYGLHRAPGVQPQTRTQSRNLFYGALLDMMIAYGCDT